MRNALAGLLGLVVPGIGHAIVGRRRAAILFVAPVVLLVAALVGMYAGGGFTSILAFVVTPGVLPALAVLNVALAAWRIAAAVDVARLTDRPKPTAALLAPAIVVLVLVPHLWLAWTIAVTNDFLDSMFASGPQPTGSPEPEITPGSTSLWSPWWTATPIPSGPQATPTEEPEVTRPPGGTFTSGAGGLPALGVAVPWQRPGAVPWGDDGRFDLLLLGSDAGPDRWSRRIDVMLLVEIDVATGKVAMIGLPRNIVNAPFPPGAARNAASCGCFQDLLNALYVEATVRHPERWPGSGAVSGIGAVRGTIAELTGRPVDGVLVADLWGVIKVIDAMGGLDIYVPSAVYDSRYPDPLYGSIELYIPKGEQHLDGRLTLAYARSRHSSSDYARMARQQTILLAIRDQIGAGTILSAPALFSAAKGFAWTDLPRDSLPNLVELFGRAANASVRQLRIVPPTYPSWLTPTVIAKIRKDIAALLGVPVPPTPSPLPTASPDASLSTEPPPTEPPPTEPPPTDTPAPTSTEPPPPTDTPAPTPTDPPPPS